jgi:hypothetical protein
VLWPIPPDWYGIVGTTPVQSVFLGSKGTTTLQPDRLWRISVRAVRRLRTARVFSGGDVVVAAGSFWVIDGSAGRLLRLPLAAFGG